MRSVRSVDWESDVAARGSAAIFAEWQRCGTRSAGGRVALAVLAIAALLAAGGALASPGSDGAPNRPVEAPAEGYVTSDTCRSCHPGRHASWHASYHRTMTQVATPSSVVGRFDGDELRSGPHRARMLRNEDRFFIEEWRVAVRAKGPMVPAREATPVERHEIVLATGSHHQQFYWHETDAGRALRLAGFVYLIPEDRWIPYTSVGLGPERHPDAPLSPEPGAWNTGCMHCHATHGRMRIDLAASARGESAPMDTQVSEFGIACEACHGPGGEHVRLNRDPQRRYRQHLAGGDTTIVNPAKLSPRRSSQVCGQCHAVNLTFRPGEGAGHLNQHGFRYRPGEDLAASRTTVQADAAGEADLPRSLLRSEPDFVRERFWSDGMVRVSGREYNGLLESPCFEGGQGERQLSCLSCHVLHKQADDARPDAVWAEDQLGPGMRGDAACLQCHEKFAGAQSAHTHHAAESAGSRCQNCHMPYTTYGLLKAIRSHEIDSPRVSVSVETGRPNACNQCHLDRSLGWSARHLEAWYGQPAPTLAEDEDALPASALWLLRGDPGQRALMAWSYGWADAREASGEDWMGRLLPLLLHDPYPAVRHVAERSLRKLPGFEDFVYDPEDPPLRRAVARNRAIERWQQLQRADGRPQVPSGEVRIGAGGVLSAAAIERLVAERNPRPLTLRE